ncbi:MAG: hypothetical protein NTV93_12845 [Verrucomicrobia bacterium]|nr:hypothetical protein [Verrucomicrobiota bacterium]
MDEKSSHRKNPPQTEQNTLLSLQSGLPPDLIFFETGLAIPEATDGTTLNEAIVKLTKIGAFTVWAYADIAVYAAKHGLRETREALIRATGYSANRMAMFVRVAEAFPHKTRKPTLSFEHHQSVVEHEPSRVSGDQALWEEKSSGWLDAAMTNGWSAKELLERIAGPQKRKRQMLALGFTPRTKHGQQLATALMSLLEKHFPTENEKLFAGDVLADIGAIAGLLKSYLEGGDQPAGAGRRMDLSLEAALKDVMGGKEFGQAARDHGLKVRALGLYRLEKAAEMKDTGVTFETIKQRLRVKPDKLREYMKKRPQGDPSPPAAAEPAPQPPDPATESPMTTSCPPEANGPGCGGGPASISCCPSELAAALADIIKGKTLPDAARDHSVRRTCLIKFRRAEAEKLYAEWGSVNRVAAQLSMDYKDLRKYLAGRGLLKTGGKGGS